MNRRWGVSACEITSPWLCSRKLLFSDARGSHVRDLQRGCWRVSGSRGHHARRERFGSRAVRQRPRRCGPDIHHDDRATARHPPTERQRDVYLHPEHGLCRVRPVQLSGVRRCVDEFDGDGDHRSSERAPDRVHGSFRCRCRGEHLDAHSAIRAGQRFRQRSGCAPGRSRFRSDACRRIRFPHRRHVRLHGCNWLPGCGRLTFVQHDPNFQGNPLEENSGSSYYRRSWNETTPTARNPFVLVRSSAAALRLVPRTL